MAKNILLESTKSKFKVLEHKPANVLKRIQGVLSEVCKSVIVEYHDTNFMYWIELYVYSLVHIDEWNGFQKQNNY